MAKYSYGVASFLVGDITPVTGAILNPVEIKEAVYRDTFNMTEEEGTTTDHYSEMDTTPKVSFTEVGKETITLQLMETQAAMLERFLGGTVTTLEGQSTWHKPQGAPSIEKFIKITTVDGTLIQIPRAKVTGRKNLQFRRNGIWLIDVTITPLSPLLGAISAMEITDPV